jgi:hypothetical protein
MDMGEFTVHYPWKEEEEDVFHLRWNDEEKEEVSITIHFEEDPWHEDGCSTLKELMGPTASWDKCTCSKWKQGEERTVKCMLSLQ